MTFAKICCICLRWIRSLILHIRIWSQFPMKMRRKNLTTFNNSARVSYTAKKCILLPCSVYASIQNRHICNIPFRIAYKCGSFLIFNWPAVCTVLYDPASEGTSQHLPDESVPPVSYTHGIPDSLQYRN